MNEVAPLPLKSMINALKSYRANNTAKEGLELAKRCANELGGSVDDNPEGGIIINLLGSQIHVWQPYPDIDYIYFEY
jgi:hypothetical protein